jgi:hypothetical protein
MAVVCFVCVCGVCVLGCSIVLKTTCFDPSRSSSVYFRDEYVSVGVQYLSDGFFMDVILPAAL